MMRGHDVSGGADCLGRKWRRSSRSYGSGNCLEVAAHHGELIDVRDSKDPQGATLRFAATTWIAFIAGVSTGELGG
jgi:hypothetical protein